MRTFGAMAIGGLAGIVALKLLATMLLPLFGLVFGVVGMLLKIGLWVAVGYVVYTLIKGRRREQAEA